MSTIGESHRPLREVVAEEIRKMILRGDLATGERLLEDKVAEQLGVSRNPVREAIRSLEATGLVEVIPRRGTYVSRVDAEDIRKLLAVRGLLEGYAAAEAAAQAATPELVDALTRCIDQGKAASTTGNHVRAAEVHRDFHVLVERAADNPYIEQVVQPLRQRTEMVFSLLHEERGHLTWHEHERVRDAIAAGDPDAAMSAVRDHLDAVIAAIKRSQHNWTAPGGGT